MSASDPQWTHPALLAAAVLVAVAGWLLWLNWHADDEPWRVTGLILSLCLVALAGGWLRHGPSTVAVVTVTTVAMFSIDASTDTTDGANFWPVGAIFLTIAAVPGLAAVAGIAALARTLADRTRARRGW
jgi:hypothetical protein